jgi:hypothetical protein
MLIELGITTGIVVVVAAGLIRWLMNSQPRVIDGGLVSQTWLAELRAGKCTNATAWY